MNRPLLVDWQIWDEEIGACLPWLTHPFLDVLKTWDLSDKRVIEFGGGLSSRYWRKRAKWVTTIDTNHDWMIKIVEECTGLSNGTFIYMPIAEADEQHIEAYVNAGDEYGPYDIVVVDGIFRDECLKKGIEILNKRGGIIIADNWIQDFVWLSEKAIETMKPFEQYIFPQLNHTNHEGNCWKTAYFVIPPRNGKIVVPEEFYTTSDWDSHRPLLCVALQNKNGFVVEFGCGNGSTMLLSKYAHYFASFETNKEWADKFEGITQHIESYFQIQPFSKINILFIDSAPGEDRPKLVEEYRHKAEIIIIHDTEPDAEYVYHLQNILSSFKYRCDLVGIPRTTAVSETYNLQEWTGLLNDKYHIV